MKLWLRHQYITAQFSAFLIEVFDTETFHHTDFIIIARIESNAKNKNKQVLRKGSCKACAVACVLLECSDKFSAHASRCTCTHSHHLRRSSKKLDYENYLFNLIFIDY